MLIGYARITDRQRKEGFRRMELAGEVVRVGLSANVLDAFGGFNLEYTGTRWV